MAEMDERSETELEEAVSNFIVFTCRHFEAERYDKIFKYHSRPSHLYNRELGTMFESGSNAEFYIRPILSCIEDRDEMHCFGNKICYNDKIPSMSHDLRYFHDDIQCFRIVSSTDYPGFCRLIYEGNLTYNWNSKKYNYFPIAEPPFIYTGSLQQKRESVQAILSKSKKMSIRNHFKIGCTGRKHTFSAEIYGPAVKLAVSMNDVRPIDIVHCIWCPHWPKEAKNWPSRSRNNGWPTAETIQKIVKEGCNIVIVKHRDYEEPMPGTQFRFSFSYAEVVLLNSWTPTQQIVYHMLRYFAKRELIQKDCPKEKEALCCYHLKTLMLWTCEEKPAEWWNTNTVVEICRKILITLSEWLRKRRFPNYFIPTAYLISQSVKEDSIKFVIGRINNFCMSNKLNKWFLANYCRPICEDIFEPSEITMNIATISECTEKISDSEEAGYFWHFNRNLIELHTECMQDFSFEEIGFDTNSKLRSQCKVSDISRDILSKLSLNSYFLHLASALLLLCAEYAITCLGLPCDCVFIVDHLTFIQMKCTQSYRKCHNFPQPYRRRLKKSHVMFLRAQELMEVFTGPCYDSEFQLCCRISMILLKKCLEIRDNNSHSIRPAALAYLAAFYFANAEFQTSLDLCSTIIENQDSSQSTKALNAGCLLFFDDIANITGFFLLWKRCQDRHYVQNNKHSLGLHLTPQFFAMYLIWGLGQSYRKPFPETKMYILDVLLITIIRQRRLKSHALKDCTLFMNRGVSTHRNDGCKPGILSNGKFENVIDIVSLLQALALKRIEVYNSMIFHRFGFQWNCVDCYRALYFYKYHRYDDVFSLCDNILKTPDNERPQVMVLPPFDSFFDSDIRCLLGLKTLYHFFDLQNVTRNVPFSDHQLEMRNALADLVQNGDPLIKMENHPFLKYHGFIRRHFLANYLKLRCIIHCNGPDAGKCSVAFYFEFPFEHLIMIFLRQKFSATFRFARLY